MMHTLSPTAEPATDIDDVARLVTPDGERIADRELDPLGRRHRRRGAARPLPRHDARAPHRHRGRRPAASGPARTLGALPGPGGHAGRNRARVPLRRLRLPELPRDRRELRPRRDSLATSCSRGAARRTRRTTRTTSTPRRRRSSSAPSPCTPSATRWASSATAPTRSPPPTSATAPPARAMSTRRWSSPPRSAPRSCSCARTTSGRSPSRSPCRRSSRSPAARRASASRACGSTATTSSRASQRCAGRSTTPARGNGPVFIEAVTYRMGPHTTSDDPTRYRDKDEVERWRRRDPLDPRRGAAARTQGEFADEFAARRRRRGRPLGRGCARGMPVGAHHREPIERLRPRLRRAARRASTSSAPTSRPTSTASRMPLPEVARDDAADDGEVHQRGSPPRDGRRSQGARHGRGHRQARRRVPRHRRPARPVRRAARDRHAARRVGHHGHRGRPRLPRLPPGRRDPVRRLRLSRVRPDRLPGREAPLPHARQRDDADHDPHPVGRGSRRRRAPLRVARGVLRAHLGAARRRGLEPAGRVRHAAPGDRLERPGRLLRAEAAVPPRRARSTSTSISPTRRRWGSRASPARAAT